MDQDPRTEFLRLAIGIETARPPEPQSEKGIWCWHCCHPFTTPKIPLPTRYDERRDAWKTTGTFCSWACAKAYNIDSKSNFNSTRAQLLVLLKKRMTGKLEGIVPAPPRTRLQVFGGPYSIEEFRSKSESGIVIGHLPPNMVSLESIAFERKIEAKRVARAPGPDLEQNVEFAPGQTRNETLRLKRPKPTMNSSDVLARTMGLEINGL